MANRIKTAGELSTDLLPIQIGHKIRVTEAAVLAATAEVATHVLRREGKAISLAADVERLNQRRVVFMTRLAEVENDIETAQEAAEMGADAIEPTKSEYAARAKVVTLQHRRDLYMEARDLQEAAEEAAAATG